MKRSITLFLLLPIVLCGCELLTDMMVGYTPPKRFVEPENGERARIRISASNSTEITLSHCEPNSTGMIIGKTLDNQPDYKNRDLGIPDPDGIKARPGFTYAEFYVRAGKKTFLSARNYACSIAFVPEKDHDYEFVVDADSAFTGTTERCAMESGEIIDGKVGFLQAGEGAPCPGDR
ncbi:hypothetical protein [Cardiobacterium valvarum]|uniref:Lipoprotein n=1 Tax=Cardiobacterium valvarum F0432 TaxID=797473 RepID=G9ZH44_9GAMM|nr:hypothetical protein [Cardiobacterium valvarum]EHM52796.1 hypothetical protein HMPREF9080_02101 [Cardiobacterium valvarum F0432]